MSRPSTRRVAALLSALALTVGGVAVATVSSGTTSAGPCCTTIR
ncbi:MAG TPA: hypothetical protein VE781_09995 [Kineosporiaceae bacterium]|nr:hypothetical protein [Kineosporiaceae bacterium]